MMDQVLEEKYRSETAVKPVKSRVLIAPLDWGLGHATRCIPLIRHQLARGSEVFLAGEGAQEILLKNEFPDLPFLKLNGYRINYARSASGLALQMLRQVNKIRSAIRYEHEWLKKTARELQLDTVISDNRYGLYNDQLNSIFITHQLTIKTGYGKWSERLLQNRNYNYINRFRECWVPDEKGENNLAGELSHPQKKPAIPLQYIGPQSRFNRTGMAEKKDHILILLSGPEPQRSVFEEIIIRQLHSYNGMICLIRGLPESSRIIPSTEKILIYNHLPACELNEKIESASLVIARSGYSTIMDLACLRKKAVLIPTPGQTEQEYLAEYLSAKKIAATISQRSFSLTEALRIAENFEYKMEF